MPWRDVTARGPLVVAEDAAALDGVRSELLGAGWHPVELAVRGADGVAQAVLAALTAGQGSATAVLVDASGAGPGVVGDLVDDLDRIAPVLVRRAATTPVLDEIAWRLLHALAAGATLAGAARASHVSLRTANRRLTDAVTALGAGTRAQAVRALGAAERVPPAG